jgi:tetratricopeptide (TPR) repeat protein
MNNLDQLRAAINRSSELWKAGARGDALKLLDESIAAAVKKNDVSSVVVLSHHAAVLASATGDLPRVKYYYMQSLHHDPGNPRALYGLARLLAAQGEHEAARDYAKSCYEALLKRGDNEIERKFLELVLNQWPELGSAH